MIELEKSYRISEEIISRFEADTILPMARKLADEVYSKVNDNMIQWLMSDTQANLAMHIRNQAEHCIDALILGDKEMLARYPYQEYERGRKLREALVQHCNDDILKLRISDLESEVARLKEDLEFYRRYRP